jgi:hypothetical protein
MEADRSGTSLTASPPSTPGWPGPLANRAHRRIISTPSGYQNDRRPLGQCPSRSSDRSRQTTPQGPLLDAHTPSTGDSDEPRSSLTSTAPCSPACAATRPGQGDANGQQYGPGGPATAGSGRPHNRRRSGRQSAGGHPLTPSPGYQARLEGEPRPILSRQPARLHVAQDVRALQLATPEVPSPIRPLPRSRQRGREFPEPHGIPTIRRLGSRVTHRYLLSNPYAAEISADPPPGRPGLARVP